MKNRQLTPRNSAALGIKYAVLAMIVAATSVAQAALIVGEAQVNLGDVEPSPLLPLGGDLLETSVATVTGENATALVRNGAVYGNAQGNGGAFPAAVWGEIDTTYTFDVTSAAFGYDITEVRAYSAWGDRASQSYRIFCSLISDPTSFIQLGGDISALSDNSWGVGTAPASIITRTYDTLGGAILTNVAAIRFQQYDGSGWLDGTATIYRELDVVGVASVPEPTSMALVGLAVGGIALLRLRRKQKSVLS